MSNKEQPTQYPASASPLPTEETEEGEIVETSNPPQDDSATAATTTVFEDPVNFNAKHPLQNSWTLWFDNPQNKRTGHTNWEKSLKKLVTFDTVEDFWGVYNNVVNSSLLAHGANYHLFKDGVRPMWEDPENENGGKWIYNMPKGKRAEMLDESWLFTMLACVGESFPDPDEICGAVVSIRTKGDRIALWTKTALNEDAAKDAGGHWKGVLHLGERDPMGYQPHSDALRKSSRGSSSDMYTV